MKHPAFSSKWGPSRLVSLVLQAFRLLYSDSTQLRGVEQGVHTRPVKFSHFQNRPVTRNEPGPKQVNEAFPRSLWYGLKVIFKKWPLSLTCRLRTRVRWESGKHRLSACYLKVSVLLPGSLTSVQWAQSDCNISSSLGGNPFPLMRIKSVNKEGPAPSLMFIEPTTGAWTHPAYLSDT